MTILDDGINVMGSGSGPTPTPITPTIATPANGAQFTTGQQVVFTGTANPNVSITVQAWNSVAGSWTTVTTTTASSDGIWTADPVTAPATAGTWQVRPYDGTTQGTIINLVVVDAVALEE